MNDLEAPSLTEGGIEKPNKLKTAACCELLGSFADMAGPLSGVLLRIRDELLKSIYSEICMSDRGILEFTQQTFFCVAEKLEMDKAALVIERESFKSQLQEQQQMFHRIEEQMEIYRQAVTNAQIDSAAARSRLESLSAGHQAAMTEAKTGQMELKKARKEVLKMKDDLEAEMTAHKNLKDIHDYSINEYKAQIADRDEKINALRRDLEEFVPVSTVDNLKRQCEDSKLRISELEGSLMVLESKVVKLENQMGSMTPKPNWDQLLPHIPGIVGESQRTQDLLNKATSRLDELKSSSDVAETQIQAKDEELRLLDALDLPEPIPQLISLSLVTDSSAYFITEQKENAEEEDERKPTIRVESLGLTSDAPRCLRFKTGELLRIETKDLEEAEAEAEAIWTAKAEHDKENSVTHLTSFLYHYYQREIDRDVASSSEDQRPSRIELHRRLASKAYSLFHTCSVYSNESSKIRLLGAVLTGQLALSAKAELETIKRNLFDITCCLPASSGDLIQGSGITNCLVALFPHRDAWSLHKLKEAFRTGFLVGSDAVSLHTLMAALLPSSSLKEEQAPVFNDGEKAFIDLLEQQYLDELEGFQCLIAKALSSPATDEGEKEQGESWSKEAALVKAGISKLEASQACTRSPASLRAFCLLKPTLPFCDFDGAMKALHPDGPEPGPGR